MASRAPTRTSTSFSGWTLQAILAGVFMSLVIQILLTMLGAGAAYAAGMSTTGQLVRAAAEPIT